MVCTGRFFFALFSLFRSSLSIGLLERPLVIGLFWGAFSGDFQTSLHIAIFFELFWLDLIPVGTFIPPHLAASTFFSMALTTWFDLESPAEIMIIMFTGMPLAWAGAWVEGIMRERQKKSYNRLLNWARNPVRCDVPGQIILRSTFSSLFLSWILFFVTLLAFEHIFDFIFTNFSSALSNLQIAWPHLWIAATLGGVMALRVKRAYVVLTLGIGFVLFFSIWPSIAWQP